MMMMMMMCWWCCVDGVVLMVLVWWCCAWCCVDGMWDDVLCWWCCVDGEWDDGVDVLCVDDVVMVRWCCWRGDVKEAAAEEAVEAEEAAAGWSKKNKNPTWQCGEQLSSKNSQRSSNINKTNGTAWNIHLVVGIPIDILAKLLSSWFLSGTDNLRENWNMGHVAMRHDWVRIYHLMIFRAKPPCVVDSPMCSVDLSHDFPIWFSHVEGQILNQGHLLEPIVRRAAYLFPNFMSLLVDDLV